jgi:hypothetical protein
MNEMESLNAEKKQAVNSLYADIELYKDKLEKASSFQAEQHWSNLIRENRKSIETLLQTAPPQGKFILSHCILFYYDVFYLL